MRKKLVLFCVFIILITGVAFGEAKSDDNHISIQKTQTIIREILQDNRFQYPDYFGWLKKWWQKIVFWLKKLQSTKTNTDQQFIINILKWIGLGCLLLLPVILIFLIPKLFSSSWLIRQKKVDSSDNFENGLLLKSQAIRLAETGEFREAIRYLYLAILEHLKLHGILPNGIRLTDKANMEVLSKAVGSDNQSVKVFIKLVGLFQDKWYGLNNCQAEEYWQALEYFNLIQENIGR